MLPEIVDNAAILTLLGGGEAPEDTVNSALFRAPVLVAADGGADLAFELGHRPQAVIGDLDSLSDKSRAKMPPNRIFQVDGQDDTDFDKCLALLKAPVILCVGMTGRRLDHTLAAFNTLARNPHRAVILMGPLDICFHCPPSLSLELARGSRFSLFPMAAVTGRSLGLTWPIEGIDFRPDGASGTSNRVSGPVTLDFDRPGMVAVLPHSALDIVLRALRRASLWVPR